MQPPTCQAQIRRAFTFAPVVVDVVAAISTNKFYSEKLMKIYVEILLLRRRRRLLCRALQKRIGEFSISTCFTFQIFTK